MDFEEILGYKFKNKELLFNALTHSSYANEIHSRYGSNERLEFLGDSVLSIIVSEYLYVNYKDLPEGEHTVSVTVKNPNPDDPFVINLINYR